MQALRDLSRVLEPPLEEEATKDGASVSCTWGTICHGSLGGAGVGRQDSGELVRPSAIFTETP